MGVYNFIKRMFGFSVEDEEDEQVEPTQPEPYINPFKKETPKAEATEVTPAETTADHESSLSDEITNKIIEILNAGLPDYAKSSIDINAEKKFVNNLLGETLNSFSQKVKATATDSIKSKQQAEMINIEKEKAIIEKSLSESKTKIEELRTRLQSSELQRNAAKERIQQLENRVNSAEAERDQFQLETKSLMNKLKVASFNNDANNSLNEEIDRLNKEKEELKTNLDNAQKEIADKESSNEANIAAIAEKDNTIAELQKQLEIINESIQQDNSKETIENLQKEIKSLNERNNFMQEDFNSKTAEKDNTISELHTQIGVLSDAVDKDKNKEIILGLQKEITSLNDRNYSIQEKCNDKIEEIAKLEKEISTLNEKLAILSNSSNALAEKDATIAKMTSIEIELNQKVNDMSILLKDQNEEISRLKGNNDELESSIKQLNAAITNETEVHKAEDMKLRQEIELLRSKNEELQETIKKEKQSKVISFEDPVPVFKPEKKEQKQQKKETTKKERKVVSAIDYSNDNSDWLLPTPPTLIIPIEKEEEEEKVEQQRKSDKPHPAQMQLF